MPIRYRIMIASLGVLILVGGALGILSVPRLATAGQQVRAVLGGLIAAGIGVAFVVAAYRNRAPAWLTDLLGGG